MLRVAVYRWPRVGIVLLALGGMAVVTTCGALPWSYTIPIPTVYAHQGTYGTWAKIILCRGRVCLLRTTVRENLTASDIEFLEFSKDFQGLRSGPEQQMFGRLGFFWFTAPVVYARPGESEDLKTYHRLDIPLWLPLIILSLLTALVGRETRRASRIRRRGLCANCEYDLRGNVLARCPECGTTVAAQSRARESEFPAELPRVVADGRSGKPKGAL